MADAQGDNDGQALAVQTPTHRWQRLRGANGQWYHECRAPPGETVSLRGIGLK